MSIADKLTAIAENEQKVFDAGEKAEYDKFWDAFQKNGEAKCSTNHFRYGWNAECFNPKYPIIIPDNISTVFSKCTWLIEINVPVHILGQTQQIFYQCSNLKTLSKLVVTEESTYANMFISCSALENLVIEGTIGNAFNIADCDKLSKASIESIISHLSDTATELTATFSTAAKENAFTTEEWDTLIATKPNWTIALA